MPALTTEGLVGGGLTTEGIIGGAAAGPPVPSGITITFVSPDPDTTPGGGGGFPALYAAAAATPIVVTVTDSSGVDDIAYVAITAIIYGVASETVYRNVFAGSYSEGSSTLGITDGIQFSILRGDGGWIGANAETNLVVGIIVDVVNASGVVASATAYYEMPAQGVITSNQIQPVPQPPGIVDHIAQALDYIGDQFRSTQ